MYFCISFDKRDLAKHLAEQSDEDLWVLEECLEQEYARRQSVPHLNPSEMEQLSVSHIEAVKMYRARIGCSLKEAKRVVDNTRAWLDEQERCK